MSVRVHAKRRYKVALPQFRGLMTTFVQYRRSPCGKIQTQYRPPAPQKAPERSGAFCHFLPSAQRPHVASSSTWETRWPTRSCLW